MTAAFADSFTDGDSGINSAEAKMVLGDFYDCLHEKEEFLDFFLNSQEDEGSQVFFSLLLSSDKDLFVSLLLAGAHQDPESAEALSQMEALLAAICH